MVPTPLVTLTASQVLNRVIGVLPPRIKSATFTGFSFLRRSIRGWMTGVKMLDMPVSMPDAGFSLPPCGEGHQDSPSPPGGGSGTSSLPIFPPPCGEGQGRGSRSAPPARRPTEYSPAADNEEQRGRG